MHLCCAAFILLHAVPESIGRIPSNANIAKLGPHITILRTIMHGDVLTTEAVCKFDRC